MKNIFEEFIPQAEEIKERLYRIAYLYLANESSAIEAVDEAIYQAYHNIKKLRQVEYFKTWLTRILINVCKKELRRLKREKLLAEFTEGKVEDYDGLPLKEAIAKLPEELRIIIILRYFNDLTVVQTAEILKLPQGTVATRQRKALNLLKLELEDNYNE
jgi:RNA polymerase sigma factor (sigma-70 family)